jgi:hypothetical protein
MLFGICISNSRTKEREVSKDDDKKRSPNCSNNLRHSRICIGNAGDFMAMTPPLTDQQIADARELVRKWLTPTVGVNAKEWHDISEFMWDNAPQLLDEIVSLRVVRDAAMKYLGWMGKSGHSVTCNYPIDDKCNCGYGDLRAALSKDAEGTPSSVVE